MLTKMSVTSQRLEVLEFPLHDSSNGFLVKKIEGLDPVTAEISSSPFAQVDGTQYHASQRGNRNIVITLGLRDDQGLLTVQQLRNVLYRFFMPKSAVNMSFFLDDVLFAGIEGRVESLETELFAKEPEVQISVICFDPDFIAPRILQRAGETVADMTTTPVFVDGTIETGFEFRLAADRAVSAFTIYNDLPNGDVQTFEYNSPLSSGDVLVVSTVSGAKGVTRIRNGVRASRLYAMTPTSDWVQFYPGENSLRVYAEGLPIRYAIDYRPRYGGL